MDSALLEGSIRHRRLSPIRHDFRYRIALYAVNLDEWDGLDRLSWFFSTRRFSWAWLRRRDYLGEPGQSLAESVRHRVREQTGREPGRIELVTHPRYLGFCFNPVSFYLCYEADADPARGDPPWVILAQITNTPWLERLTYCLAEPAIHQGRQGWRTLHFRFTKQFHVSPYNPMNQLYDWRFSFRPGEMRIQMNASQADRKVFDATLVVQRHLLDRKVMGQSLRRYPWESIKGVLGIYWQALVLKLKGARFQTHPDKDPGNRPLARADNTIGKVTSCRP